MRYVSWAALYEGDTDAAYFNVLIPRLMEELVIAGTQLATIPELPAIRLRRAETNTVAREACDSADAFRLVFIHADMGGRAQAEQIDQRSIAYCAAMHELCNWPPERCITVTPRHETEAWVLADPVAVTSALGYAGRPATIGLPAGALAAERLADPKATLREAVSTVRGRRRAEDLETIVAAVAQRQSFTELRRSISFRGFEAGVRAALDYLGCL